MTIFLSICLEREFADPENVTRRKRTGTWNSLKRPTTRHFTTLAPRSSSRHGSRSGRTSSPNSSRSSGSRRNSSSAHTRDSGPEACRGRSRALRAVCVRGLPVSIPQPTAPEAAVVVAAEPEPALYSFPALAPGLAATPEEEEEDCAAHVLSMSNPGGGAYEVYDPVFDSAEETESSTKSSLELKRGETGGAYDAADAGKGGVWLEHADCREPTSPKGVREMRGGFWGGVRMRYDEWRCGAYWNKA